MLGRKISKLQCQNEHQNDRLQRLSETVESKFYILVKAPKLFEKCKYDEQEQVIASTSSKRARASADNPPRRFRTRSTNRIRRIKSPSDDENSSATRPLGRMTKKIPRKNVSFLIRKIWLKRFEKFS